MLLILNPDEIHVAPMITDHLNNYDKYIYIYIYYVTIITQK